MSVAFFERGTGPRLAYRKREQYVGPWLPEPIRTPETAEMAEAGDPERRVDLQESVSLAFLSSSLHDHVRAPENAWVSGGWVALFLLYALLAFLNMRSGGVEGPPGGT